MDKFEINNDVHYQKGYILLLRFIESRRALFGLFTNIPVSCGTKMNE